MRWGAILGAILATTLHFVTPAFPQATVKPCVTTGTNTCPPVSASNPMPVSGTVTATPSGTQSVAGVGTAGTADAGVLTVQGVASMTPLLSTVSQGTAASLNATVVGTGTFAVQISGASFTNITTNADTNVKASAGTFVGITVNSIGTTSTAKIFNDADGTCSTGLIATITTVLQASLTFNVAAGTGICVQTAGAAAADITILYR